jgi:hypothetical protein
LTAWGVLVRKVEGFGDSDEVLFCHYYVFCVNCVLVEKTIFKVLAN